MIVAGTAPEPVEGQQPGVNASEDDLARIRSLGEGYIYNDFAGRGASGRLYNVLHRARCRELRRANLGVPKCFFTSLHLAESWLERNRGPEEISWKRCGTCLPGS